MFLEILKARFESRPYSCVFDNGPKSYSFLTQQFFDGPVKTGISLLQAR
jgi:hypothetical protein